MRFIGPSLRMDPRQSAGMLSFGPGLRVRGGAFVDQQPAACARPAAVGRVLRAHLGAIALGAAASGAPAVAASANPAAPQPAIALPLWLRSEEHTSELQSRP